MTKLERRSPLAEHPLLHKAQGARAQAGVTVEAGYPLALLQVSAFIDGIDATVDRICAVTGLPLPQANHMTGDATVSLRAVGPGIWQICGDADRVPQTVALRAQLDGVATVVDLGHARASLRLTGPDATRTLAKHCGLDLDLAAFPAGSATNTRFGHLGMTLSRTDETTFELLVFRGYATYVFESLVQSATEFGVHVGR